MSVYDLVADILVGEISPRSPLLSPGTNPVTTRRLAPLAPLARSEEKTLPPPLTADELSDMREAVEERAAIRQFDGGQDRDEAEREARSAMRVYQMLIAMPDGTDPRWITTIAPGCTLEEARRDAEQRFGPERVLEVHEHRGGSLAGSPPSLTAP